MTDGTAGGPSSPAAPMDPAALLRDPKYVVFLVFGAVIGVPVAIFSYFFLKTVNEGNQFFFTDLPRHLGFEGEPVWWPLLPLFVSGLLVALAIRYLRGRRGTRRPTGSSRPVSSLPSSCPASWSRRWPRSAWALSSGPKHRSSPSGAVSGCSSSTW